MSSCILNFITELITTSIQKHTVQLIATFSSSLKCLHINQNTFAKIQVSVYFYMYALQVQLCILFVPRGSSGLW